MAKAEIKTETAVNDVAGPMAEPSETKDGFYYFLAVILGALAGLLQAALRDALLTALLVVSASMFLGFMRPARPWRWVLLVALPVPAVMMAANLLHFYRDLTRAGLFGSALITLPAIAGAYGGHFGRGFLRMMFGTK